MRSVCLALVVSSLLLAERAIAQQVSVQEVVLDNGMKFLLVPRKGDPNVAAGWLAKVGSVNERPGITGISHLFEHMMFKGTRTIGTTNIDEDLKLMAQMDQVKAAISLEEQAQLRRLRLGEISSLEPSTRSQQHQQLLQELAELEKRQKALLQQNEFDRIYTSAGASGMNAGTDYDYTVYFINVPANKLELWFWMESDRLLHPVFREFYAERDVVREERRLRIESTPIGKFDEQFDALFWNTSPYQWPVVGWPSDLEGITRDEAQAYYDLNYAPNNLVGCLVGDFDPSSAKALAARYFGRLPRNPKDPPPVRTREVEPLAERRMMAYAETNPQVEMRYLTVADGHRDEPALVVLGSLLSGRTGRLYKSLVLDKKIATAASAGQNGLKWQGYFSVRGTARPGHTPEEVQAALDAEIQTLKTTPVGEHELQKVKNQFAAATYRRLSSNFALMLQLLLAESNRGWQAFNDDPKRIDAVTPADVQRVTQRYLTPASRAVVLYYTKQASVTSSAGTDPVLEGLSDEERSQLRAIGAQIAQLSVEQAKAMLGKLTAEEPSAPPEKKKFLTALKALLAGRIASGGGQ